MNTLLQAARHAVDRIRTTIGNTCEGCGHEPAHWRTCVTGELLWLGDQCHGFATSVYDDLRTL